jgi:hypothetical protein
LKSFQAAFIVETQTSETITKIASYYLIVSSATHSNLRPIFTFAKMSAYQVLSAQPGLTAQPSYSEDQIDLIWAMGLASLESNNGELVLPQPMETSLTKSQIDDLKLRLR